LKFPQLTPGKTIDIDEISWVSRKNCCCGSNPAAELEILPSLGMLGCFKKHAFTPFLLARCSTKVSGALANQKKRKVCGLTFIPPGSGVADPCPLTTGSNEYLSSGLIGC